MKSHNDNKEDDNSVYTFYQNPNVDILFGSINNSVPSKKQDFKPIDARFVDENGQEQILRDFYVKKPSSKSVKNFESLIHQMLDKPYYKEKRIAKPAIVEVTISLSLIKSEYDKVDVDNVAKTVLDSIKGYLIDDDSQVVRLMCEKMIHPMNIRSFLIAITELKPDRNGLFGGYWLYTSKKPEK